MRYVIVYHPYGGVTKFEGEATTYDVQADGSLLVLNWETSTELGNATFANGQWAQVRGSIDKEVQATRLVVTMGSPVPR